jgi:DNA-binding response OmpR family regulator
MKILLVDDDAFLRDMYAVKFTEAGYKVEAAQNGEVALRLASEHTFDVVLLDMVMPGMTGLELLEKLKAIPGAKDAKHIVLSNQGEESDKSAAQAAGAAGYIVKAESIPSEVVTKVEAICKQ